MGCGKVVLVCGGRDYADRVALFAELDARHAAHPIGCVVHGAAKGADRLAGEWARSRGIRQQPFPADWKAHGAAAGPMRNQRMLDEGRPDLVVAFPGRRGTADMTRRATMACVPVLLARTRRGREAAGAPSQRSGETMKEIPCHRTMTTDNDKLLDDYDKLCQSHGGDVFKLRALRNQILARMGAVAEAKPAVDWAAHRVTVEDYFASGSRIAAAILALIDAEAARAAKREN